MSPIISGAGSGGGSGVVVSGGAQGNNGGNLTTASASFVDLTGLSVTVAAAAGDLLYAALSGAWSFSTTGAANNVYFQLVTTTGAHAICGSAYNAGTVNLRTPFAIVGIYTVVSGDISGGNVAVKAQFACDGGNTVTCYNASGNFPTMAVVNMKH